MDKYFQSLHDFRRTLINAMRKIQLTDLDSSIKHEQVLPVASYAPWANDKGFLEIYEIMKDHTLVDIYRCYELYSLTKNLNNRVGDIIEVGVWKGGTAAIIAKASEEGHSKTLLFDTFEGVPKAGANDTRYKGGEHADTSLETIIQLMKRLNLTKYEIFKGIFPEDFPNMKLDKIKLVHIDVDVYQSGADIFNYVWPKMVIGGVVVFDDCGGWGCEGITKLFNEISFKDAFKVYNLNGHGLVIKVVP